MSLSLTSLHLAAYALSVHHLLPAVTLQRCFESADIKVQGFTIAAKS